MKLVKTASGKTTLKITRSEWKGVGEQAGWFRRAVDNPSLQSALPAAGMTPGTPAYNPYSKQYQARTPGQPNPNNIQQPSSLAIQASQSMLSNLQSAYSQLGNLLKALDGFSKGTPTPNAKTMIPQILDQISSVLQTTKGYASRL